MIKDGNGEPNMIQPGATIGIFGSGQLGRMMAIAAKQMGYRVHVYSPTHDSPAGQVADLEFQANYEDGSSVARFAKQVDVATVEFENIPVQTLDWAAEWTRVHPGRHLLAIAQNRIEEKRFLTDYGIPTCRYHEIRSLSDLEQAARAFLPGILKTAQGGYDGKGQYVVRELEDVQPAWEALKTDQAVFEEVVEFESEFSVIAARNSAGMIAVYPTIHNEHQNQILELSVSPSSLEPEVSKKATGIAQKLMHAADAVGVVCVEFFCAPGGRVLVNEIAPRPHNSGHLTIDAFVTSQFEQHVRAICGLSLGSTRQLTPAAMVNLLGREWDLGDPRWSLGVSLPNVKLHLYGKDLPKTERKMGHMTALANTTEQAREHALAARRLLTLHSESARKYSSREWPASHHGLKRSGDPLR